MRILHISVPFIETFPYIISRISFLLFLLLFASSCNTDDFKDLENATLVQESSYAFAVATVDFTLGDILEDDTTLTIGNDNGIHLIYREDNFFQLTAANVLEELTGTIDETFTQNSTIGVVEIDDISLSTSLPFGNMLEDFGDLVLINYLESANGTMTVIPPFEESVFTDQAVPTSNDFTALQISSGTMSITLTNNLFFDIENMDLEIIDVLNNQSVGVFHFNYIEKGDTETKETELAGKNISNEFKVVLSSLKSPGTGNQQVLVELSAMLDIQFDMKGITIQEGVVMIPAGQLTEDEMTLEFNTDNDERIKSLVLKDAQFGYTIASEVNTEIEVLLTFPAITRNNMPITHTLLISPTGNSGPISGTLDFSNTLWQLDQDNDQPYNRVKATYTVFLPAGSGGQFDFSSEDGVDITFNVHSLDVEEAVGYFGFRQEQFEENTVDLGFDFSIFADQSSPILFSDPVMRIEIQNSFGIPLQGEFNARAIGHFGEEADLNPPKVIINYPAMSEMGQTTQTLFVINKVNSDLVNMLSVFPSLIKAEGTATINPNADPASVNFIRHDSELNASVEFDLPFKFKSQNLVYRDTSNAINLGMEDGNFTIDDIQTAEMKIVYTNGLPIQSAVNLIALDVAGNETVIVENVQFAAATTNANGQVPANGGASGESFIDLSNEQLLLLDSADRYVYEVAMQTDNNGQTPVALYTNYRVEMGIGIKMEVKRD